MLRENWRLISRIERICDNLIIVGCFFLAYFGRSSLVFWDQYFGWRLPFEGSELAPIRDYGFVLLVGLVAYNVALTMQSAYGSMRLTSNIHLFKTFLFSSIFAFFILAAVLFLLKINLSRSFIILFCVLVTIFLACERFFVLLFLRFWRRRGRNFRNIVICGVGEQALRIAREIVQRPELGIRIRGFADLGEGEGRQRSAVDALRDLQRISRVPFSRRLIENGAALERALREFAIDEVIFTDVVDVMPRVEEMVVVCSEQGVRTTIAADLFSVGLIKSEMSYFGGMPLIHFQTPPGDRWELAVKRLIDITVSAMLLVLLAPLFLIVAIGVKLSSPGPIIFKQKRVGLNGRLFYIYKFRSMHAEAEKELEELLPFNEMSGPVFKMKNDPRITPFGRFIRRFSLDELPQLWNVFIGEMSLVGPRPPVPGEVSMYERKDRRRLSMRPGLTCTWQVTGRNRIDDFESWVKLDLEYIDNWSLMHDIILMFRTIPVVLFGYGAR
ncbi:MAG: sugar transferase [Deltaproteobacteria bacterium]|nr:sugar transferase [Deltaproteobacteria bacterium]